MSLRISRDDYRGWGGVVNGKTHPEVGSGILWEKRSQVSVDTPLPPLPELSRCGLASEDCSPSTMSHNKSFFLRLLPVRHFILATGKITLMKRDMCLHSAPRARLPKIWNTAFMLMPQ